MGKQFIDMTGWIMSEHGVPDSRLTVIERIEDYISPSGNHMSQWLCECSCQEHNKIKVVGRSLRTGNTKSCGCFNRDCVVSRQKKFNTYEIINDLVIGTSSNTNDKFYNDLCDYEKIKDICWSVCINKSGMKELRGWDFLNNKVVRMHNYLGFSKYDHIDRNELNNCRNNLRVATNQEQVWNRGKSSDKTSEVIGVSYSSRDDLWVAEFMYNGERILRKSFKNELEAIMIRLNTEVKYIKDGFSGNRHLYDKYGIITNQNDCEEI